MSEILKICMQNVNTSTVCVTQSCIEKIEDVS